MVPEEENSSSSVQPRITFFAWIWISVLISFLACLCALLSQYWNISRLVDYQKCPACYGDSLCPLLETEPDLLKVNYFGYYGWIANSFTTKNVYQGSLHTIDVMVKRLGTESELIEMDKQLCKSIPTFCKDKVDLSDDLFDIILQDVKYLLSSRLLIEQEVNHLRFCPSFENLDNIFKILKETDENKGLHLPLNKLINIWILLHLNAEPIILQVFPKEEGWPFPQYLGACGRVIFETFEGVSLLHFYSSPWEDRARLSLQLLEAADRFISGSLDFALYLLDYSPDNICVDSKQRISFVDLEHTIIVDKHSPHFDGKPITSHHSSALCNNGDCSFYSPDDICNHQTSDLNHYMLCKEILAPNGDPNAVMPEGLLHSTPAHILRRYPLFESAMFNCSSDSNLNHAIPAQVLRDLLREIALQ